MAIQIQLRQGTTTEHDTFTGAQGELTYNTTLKSLVLHDGVTAGGVKIPYLSNDLVPSTMLPKATESVVGASKIATTAIAQAGVNDTDFITAKKLRDALDFTYVDKTSVRATNTIYTNGNNIRRLNLRSQAFNNSGRTLYVEVTKNSVTNLLVVDACSASGVFLLGGSVDVPPNATYKVYLTVQADTTPRADTIAVWLESDYA